MVNSTDVLTYLERETNFRAQDILILLGPTASGKTKLAVQLAKALGAEIISADSRQVYRHMDIGTGKDLREYEDISYHLINSIEPGDKYNITRFLADFEIAYQTIKSKGKRVIVCGGTGFYIQALLTAQPYNQVPTDIEWRSQMESMSKEEINSLLAQYAMPKDFVIDRSSKKRMIRALEIQKWFSGSAHSLTTAVKTYSATVIGLNPALEERRNRITERLYTRLDQGMIDEVKYLLQSGLTYEALEYYGLEYKYISYYLQGMLDYSVFLQKLETEIHRYAKRQMTYFRKMEKDGIKIHWFRNFL